MKNFKRTVSTILAATLLATTFAGCTSNPSNPSSGEAKTPTTISFVHWRSEDVAVYKKLVSDFESKNKDIKVEMEVTSADLNEYYTLVKSRISGSQGVDVFAVHPGNYLTDFLKAGKLEDLTDQPFTKNYEEGILDCTTVDGKVYGLPQAYNVQTMFYNKTIFKENDLEVPKTWDELMNIAKVLKEKGIPGAAAGLAENWVHNVAMLQLITAYYPDDEEVLTRIDQGKDTIVNDKWKAMLTAYQDMGKAELFIKNSLGTKYEPSITLFAQKQASMLLTGTWSIGGLKQQDETLDFGYFVLPTPVGPSSPTYSPAQAISVNKDSKNKEAALKFVEYLSSVEAAKLYSTETQQISPVKGAKVESPEINAVIDLINSVPNAKSAYHLKLDHTEITEVFLKVFARAMANENVDTILAEGQKEIDTILKK